MASSFFALVSMFIIERRTEMDGMKIQSKLLRGIISKIISKNVKKKIGSDCDISINEFSFVNDGNKTMLKLDIEIGIETSKIPEILNKLGVV
jgi:hypothetical protein